MRLMNFHDAQPDWEIVKSLTPDETIATLELLVVAMLLDGRITPGEREILIDEFTRLPASRYSIGTGEVKRLVGHIEGRMRRMEAGSFGPFLDDICERIRDASKCEAVLQLVTMLAVSDGFSEDEFDLCRAIGRRFRLDEARVETILRIAWEEREARASGEFPVMAPFSREPHTEVTAPYPDTIRWTEQTGEQRH